MEIQLSYVVLLNKKFNSIVLVPELYYVMSDDMNAECMNIQETVDMSRYFILYPVIIPCTACTTKHCGTAQYVICNSNTEHAHTHVKNKTLRVNDCDS